MWLRELYSLDLKGFKSLTPPPIRKSWVNRKGKYYFIA